MCGGICDEEIAADGRCTLQGEAIKRRPQKSQINGSARVPDFRPRTGDSTTGSGNYASESGS